MDSTLFSSCQLHHYYLESGVSFSVILIKSYPWSVSCCFPCFFVGLETLRSNTIKTFTCFGVPTSSYCVDFITYNLFNHEVLHRCFVLFFHIFCSVVLLLIIVIVFSLLSHFIIFGCCFFYVSIILFIFYTVIVEELSHVDIFLSWLFDVLNSDRRRSKDFFHLLFLLWLNNKHDTR